MIYRMQSILYFILFSMFFLIYPLSLFSSFLSLSLSLQTFLTILHVINNKLNDDEDQAHLTT